MALETQNGPVGWAAPTICTKPVGTAHPTKAIRVTLILICVSLVFANDVYVCPQQKGLT